MTCVKLYQRIFRLLISVLSTRLEERAGLGPEISDQQQRELASASEAIKVNASMLSDGIEYVNSCRSDQPKGDDLT